MDPETVISAFRESVNIVDEMLSIITDALFKVVPEELIASSSAPLSGEFREHIASSADEAFTATHLALLKVISKSNLIVETLSRLNYSGDIVEVFSADKIGIMQLNITVFNNEISSAQSVVDNLKSRQGAPQNARTLITAFVDAVNHISDAMNSCINKHNIFFKNSPANQVDNVSRLSM